MATISRFIPNSHPKRLQVLTTAKQKKDGLPPAENIFKPSQSLRLGTLRLKKHKISHI